jgi:hypothetical protein
MLRDQIANVAEPCLPPDPESAKDRKIEELAFLSDHIAGETLQLLIDATWHPILSTPHCWWRTRQLSRVMDTHPRPGPPPRDKRRWERETIRKAKQERNRRRQAS